MKINELKKYLKTLNQEEMINLIVQLSKIDKKNAAFLESKYHQGSAENAVCIFQRNAAVSEKSKISQLTLEKAFLCTIFH